MDKAFSELTDIMILLKSDPGQRSMEEVSRLTPWLKKSVKVFAQLNDSTYILCLSKLFF